MSSTSVSQQSTNSNVLGAVAGGAVVGHAVGHALLTLSVCAPVCIPFLALGAVVFGAAASKK